VAVLASLITLLFIDVLLGINSLYIRDIVGYSYPSKQVLREVVLGGEFPYWNRMIAGGQPMAANPAHEVFYPLTWLILLPSYDLGFRLFVFVHLYIAAFSMYALLRSMKLGPPAAFFGALSFALGGICLSQLNLLPFLASIAWLPATCLFARRFLLHRSRRDFALAALFLGMQIVIGEPVTLLQTGFLLGLYALHAKGPLRNVAWIGTIVIAALLLAAVQALPSIDHAADSVRGRGLTFRDSSDWSMPLVRAGELLYPKLLGHHMLEARRVYWGAELYLNRSAPYIYSIYPGLLIAALALGGMLARVRGAGLALIIVAASMILALGANTPLWRWLYDAGLVRTIRFPEKFILMAVFALTIFGAKSLDLLLAGDERVRRMTARVLLATTIFAAAWVVFAITPFYAPVFAELWRPSRSLFGEMLRASRTGWVIAAVSGLLLLILLRNLTRVRRPLWLSLAGLFVLLDLGALLPELAPRIERAYYDTPPAVLRQLPPNRGDYRLFHQAVWHKGKPQLGPYFVPHPDLYWAFRNAIFPMIPARYGVQTAIDIDIDLTSLQATADFTEAAWALSRWRRDWADVAASMSNVWVRAVFIDPREAFARARGDRRVLEPVGILPFERYPRYFFAERVETIRDTNEFIRKLASRRFGKRTAFVSGASFDPASGVVQAIRENANNARIDVETRGRAFLIISVTPHKYWRITVDGREAPAVVTNVGYQGVLIPSAGRHVVEMRYRNPLIAIGAAVSIVTLLGLIGLSKI
jgi:hypothetical protein